MATIKNLIKSDTRIHSVITFCGHPPGISNRSDLLTSTVPGDRSVRLRAAPDDLPRQDAERQQKKSDRDAQDAVLDRVRERHSQLSSIRLQPLGGRIVHQPNPDSATQ